MGWIRMDLELGKFKAGSVSGINHSGLTTLVKPTSIMSTQEAINYKKSSYFF